ncbi:LBH domain-containing protein 2 [Nycticebus coucang]|uniref:LBH domain-containing protein 2 n=1 Tax=Nycticebus coucang TaxID=9470 RepID=UPI00234C81EC|nr:LBH domain-containing protein 2 [Nycticebus coucang]
MNTFQPTQSESSPAEGTSGPAGEQASVGTQGKGPWLGQQLPSIVVEPSETGAVESGEMCWPMEGEQTRDAPSQAAAAPSSSLLGAPGKAADDAGCECAEDQALPVQ